MMKFSTRGGERIILRNKYNDLPCALCFILITISKVAKKAFANMQKNNFFGIQQIGRQLCVQNVVSNILLMKIQTMNPIKKFVLIVAYHTTHFNIHHHLLQRYNILFYIFIIPFHKRCVTCYLLRRALHQNFQLMLISARTKFQLG